MASTSTIIMTTLAPAISTFNQTDPMSANSRHNPMGSPGLAASTGGAAGLPCLKDWLAVLFECFVIITLGYLSSRFRVISPEAKDLNSYLAKFALPMIIFLNIAQMEIQSVNLSFLTCILIAKSIVFISVSLITLLISRPTNFGYAGSLSILVTQSNDFALGYPLIKSLYGESHNDMLNYLSLQAPIQLLIFNPLGIAMLEYEKSRRAMETTPNTDTNNTIDNLGSSAQDDHNQDRQHQLAHVVALEGDDSCDNINRLRNISNQRSSQEGPRRRYSGGNSKTIVNLNHQQLQDHHHQIVTSDCQLKNNIIPIDQLIIDCNQHHAYTNGIHNKALTSDLNNNSTIDKGASELIYISEHDRIKDVECKLQRQLKLIRARSDPEVDQSCMIAHNLHGSNISNSTLRTDLLDSGNSNYSSSPSLPPDELTTNNNDQSRNQSTTLVNYCSSNNTLISSDLSQTNEGPLNTLRRYYRVPRCDCNFLSFIFSLITNPLIVASLVALLVNVTYGPELPRFITRVSTTIAASFAAPALFVIGLSMFGKFQLLIRSPSDLVLSLSLVFTKLMILPNLMRLLTMLILPRYLPADESSYLRDFSYLYGSLPTAPTAVLIAQQYSVLTNVVSISMLLSTVISAPLLLGVALVINPAAPK